MYTCLLDPNTSASPSPQNQAIIMSNAIVVSTNLMLLSLLEILTGFHDSQMFIDM